MIKNLLILRHADALPYSDSFKDFDRKLSHLGHLQAKMIGKFLSENHRSIDKAIISSALRAVETSEYVTGIHKKEVTKGFYNVEMDAVLECISDQNNDIATLLLIGHNPTFSNLASHISKSTFYSIPTAGLVHFELDIHVWTEIITNYTLISENKIYLS
jgi:phosphohistidine phosphatase